jgi:heptosyltransferase II
VTTGGGQPGSRALIVRLRNWVGDVVLGVPMLRLLQSHGYALQLVGKPWAVSLLGGEGWPVHVRPHRWRDRVVQLRQLRREALKLDPGFDRRPNALVLPTSFSSAFEMRCAGLRAVGYAAEARGVLLARAWPAPRSGHELTRYWALACHLLGIHDAPPEHIALALHRDDEADAATLIAREGIGPGFVVVCPFAGGQVDKQDKTWPAFADLTRRLLAQGHTLIACPGPGEASTLRSDHPGVRVLDGVSLGVYGALLRRAALLISNDTGPAHLGAAVGAAVIAVLGPTPPARWAPWGPSVEIVRRWPGWPSVDEVLERVQPRLAATTSHP